MSTPSLAVVPHAACNARAMSERYPWFVLGAILTLDADLPGIDRPSSVSQY